MNTTRTATPAARAGPDEERLMPPDGLRGLASEWLARLRAGDLGSLPVVFGLLVIWAIFQAYNSVFLSSANLVNLATECAAVGTIAIGVVLVLLVAQIDLSVGSMSGLAAAILGVGLTQKGWSIELSIVLALLAGAGVGLLYGLIFVRFGVPSFVITLSGLLALVGLQLELLGPNGSINIPFDSWIVDFTQQRFLGETLSYALAAVAVGAYLASGLARLRRRREAGLSASSPVVLLLKAGFVLALAEAGCWYLNEDRGVSLPFVLFIGLVIATHFALTRTRWGRSVYAVGGSAEAARRAGINVTRVYISVFVLCSTLAALGGLLAAGRLAAASTASGGGDVNLNAIAAAVIGGTSLFGGRGGAYSALLGVVVIESIASGLTLLSLESSARFMITGAVLMVAVIADSLSHRARTAHGRA